MSMSIVKQLPALRHPLTAVTFRRFSISISISISLPRRRRAPSPLQTLSASFAALKRPGRAAATSNRDSVLPFLSQIGLAQPDIATLLSHDPRFFCASVEDTLKPTMSWLQQMGFSHPQICHLLVLAPRPFRLSGFDCKIHFLMGVFRSIKDLLVFVKRIRTVLSCDIDNVLAPKISFLRVKCGLSATQISLLLRLSPRLLTSNLDSLSVRAQALGFKRDSAKFWQALCVVCSLSQSTIDEKLRFLRELGFSEPELKAVVEKEPMVLKMSQRSMVHKFETLRDLGLSEAEITAMIVKDPAAFICSTKKMRSVVEFLATKMGCPKSYVAHNPVILHYSLKGRLIPRHHVLETLKSKGVAEFEQKVSTVMSLTDKKFLAKFVFPFKSTIPSLHDAYISASKKGLTSRLEE